MTAAGTASTGYCKVALSHTVSGSDTHETKLYTTSAFEKDNTVKFTYNTGGFSDAEGVTATQYVEYIENTTSPTIEIASYWGRPAEDEESQISTMSLRNTAKEEIMLLSDGDVLGLAPIPCPIAKAETEVELEGFEIQESTVISAEEDYQISLTLKEGYEMPSEVVVNIDGKDYVVSTDGSEANEEAPYYDAETGVLTVPAGLLSDGIKVSVKATATQVPEETEDVIEEETEETTEEIADNSVEADDPTKKEDEEQDSDKPKRVPIGRGGNDDDDEDDNSDDSSNNDDSTSSDNNEDETEDEKADVTVNLSQLTINLEKTQIPTNADLVFTLSAKEDMEIPEKIAITLDKTVRDENIDDEEIIEDKTEYIINTDGKENPEGFEFDAETGELTISSDLLEGVREITIADIEQSETAEDDEKATISFEVKNLTFNFTDDEIATDEDVVIIFTAGEDYDLPETIVITIDGEEYIINTSGEDNPEGITFDAQTGTLTISKDLLEDAKAITITAEGVKKEDNEFEEDSKTDSKEEPEDKDNSNKENETEGGESGDKETESGTDNPTTDGNTATEGGTDAPGGENTEVTNPETNPDDTTEGEDNDDNNGEDNGQDEGKTETPKPDTEVTTPTTPDTEDNTNTEQGSENVETEENGEGTTEDGTEDTTPDAESGGNGKDSTTTEPTDSTEPSEPESTPESSKTDETGTGLPVTGGNGDDSSSTESDDSGKDNTESDDSNENTISTSPSVIPTSPAESDESTQISGDTSSTPDSSAPALSTDGNSNGESQASSAATSQESNETSSEE